MDDPATGQFLNLIAKSLQFQAGSGERIACFKQLNNTYSTTEIRQDQAEQVQGMTLDMPAKEQQLPHGFGKGRHLDPHGLFESFERRQLVHCRTNRTDTADQVSDFIIFAADYYLFKQAWGFQHTNPHVIQPAVFENQLNPAMALDTGQWIDNYLVHGLPLSKRERRLWASRSDRPVSSSNRNISS